MSKRRPSSAGLKLLTCSVAGMLISWGLCGTGSFADDHHLALGGYVFAAGSLLFVLSVAAAGIGLIMFLFTDN